METTDEIGHLSIGEVLAQLQSEFPDVTISKIRFLEAQGLIDPERTPSGYRKFYEPDIVRLTWILRQQRDHFLPLKVIKAKLDGGGPLDDDSLAVQPNLWSEVDGTHVGPPAEASADPSAPSAGTARAGGGHDVGGGGNGGATTGGSSASGPGPSATGGSRSAATDPVDDGAGARRGGRTSADRADREAAAAAEQAEQDAAAWLAALQESPKPPPASRPVEPADLGIGRGVRFGLSEVVEVTGVEAEAIESMITFGLVTPEIIGGEATFDASSVAVVRAVAAFLERGVEPRHLRMFKNAAEREAGFYEQMILPLLKQRNPKARERASATLAELAGAGDELSRALVRQALRVHLGE